MVDIIVIFEGLCGAIVTESWEGIRYIRFTWSMFYSILKSLSNLSFNPSVGFKYDLQRVSVTSSNSLLPRRYVLKYSIREIREVLEIRPIESITIIANFLEPVQSCLLIYILCYQILLISRIFTNLCINRDRPLSALANRLNFYQQKGQKLCNYLIWDS